MEKYRKTVEYLRRTADTFEKSGYGVDGITKCFKESADAIEQLAEELKQFKDKQEQGLLIELPCKVGTVIYIVNLYWHSVEIGNICGFAECDDVCCFCYKVYVDQDTYIPVAIADFGVEWFLTEAEAEEALAKMGGKE